MINFEAFCKEVELQILTCYTENVSAVEAESLAGKMLYAQLAVSSELKDQDLDARMRRSGLKSAKAAAYMDIVVKADKKPTEAAIEHMINSNLVVLAEQKGLDESETERDHLERYYNIFREAHVYFRTLTKGKFEG